MTKDKITLRQAVCIVFTFIMGTFVILNVYPEAEQDTWFSIMMAAVAAIPLILVYARIIRLFPGRDIFEIIQTLFGSIIAKALILLLVWYSLNLCGLVMRSFSDFINVTALPETPQLPILIIIALLAAYVIKSGIESLGKLSVALLVIILLAILATILLSLNKIDFTNIQPVLSHDIGELSASAFSFLMLPLSETVVTLCITDAIKKTDSPRKIYFLGIIPCVAVIIIVLLRNIVLVGVPMMLAEYYPSYIAVRVIKLGDVLSRVEGLISMIYILAGLIKAAVCMMCAAKGISSLFGVKDYRRLVMPVALIGLAISAIIYRDSMELVAFFKPYSFYMLLFGVLIPLIIWVTAEVKAKKGRRLPLQRPPG